MLSAPPETATASAGFGSNGPSRSIAAAKAVVRASAASPGVSGSQPFATSRPFRR